MPTISGSQWPKPTQWEAFEEFVADLYRCRWQDPNTQRNGRTGQRQCGVDIFGRPKELGGDQYAGIQCKLVEQGRLTRKVLEDEIARAESFRPPLAEFILATTESTSAGLQEAARLIDAERKAAGRFGVEVVFWETLRARLGDSENLDVWKKHYAIPMRLIVNEGDVPQPLVGWIQTHKRTLRWLGGILLLLVVLFLVVQIVGGVEPALHTLKAILPQPRPTPFTTPAAEGEYLIILTGFKDDSTARNLDIPTVLSDSINAELPADLNVRVAIAQGIIPQDKAEARTIGQTYNATIIIWGRYTDNLIEFNFTPLVSLDIATEQQERRVVTHSIDELAVFVNDLAAGPVRWLSLLTIGQTLFAVTRYDSAIDCFNSALNLHETVGSDEAQLAATYLYRGLAYYVKGLHDAAIIDFSRAIEIDPNNAVAYYDRGVVRTRTDDLAGAIADYTRAIELNPNDVYAYGNRGAVLVAKGDIAGAITDYTRAIELDPKDPDSYTGRGTARTAGKDVSGAIADYTRAIKLDPNDAVAYYGRGLAHHGKGDLAAAITDYTRAIELNAGDTLAYDNRGLAYYQKGDWPNAIADFSRAIEISPNFAMAYSHRALIRVQSQDFTGAIADLTRAIEIDPNNADACVKRGIARVQQDDFAGAIDDFTCAIKLEPNFAIAYANRGTAHAQQGDFAEAIADLTRAIELDPSVALFYYNAAGVYAFMADSNQACARLAQAISLEPLYRENARADVNFGTIRNTACFQALLTGK